MTAAAGQMGSPAGIIVMAKAPVAGRVKTRLCPPATAGQAAALAEASLADTLAAVMATPAAWRVVALDGEAGAWLPAGVDVIAQRGRGFDERLAAAFDDAVAGLGPPTAALVIGADTPQVTPSLLGEALATLTRPGVDAVVGPAPDGGYWALGLRRPDARVFLGVPLSDRSTLAAQRRRLESLGLRVVELASCRDVDTVEDARAVAADIPASRFARALAAMDLRTAVIR